MPLNAKRLYLILVSTLLTLTVFSLIGIIIHLKSQAVSSRVEQRRHPNNRTSQPQKLISTLGNKQSSNIARTRHWHQEPNDRLLVPLTSEPLQQFEKIDILLEKNNFILFNRCAEHRVYARVDERRPRGYISARLDADTVRTNGNKQQQQQLGPKVPDLSKNNGGNKGDKAKIKLLSMIFTVERMSNRTSTSMATSIKRQQQQQQQQQQQHQHQQQQHQVSAAAKIPSRPSEEVRLRANLTEVYICLNQRNQSFETRVNGSSLECHFNELSIDGRHVKYQSVANTSLYLGFDSNGNAICGHSNEQSPSSVAESAPPGKITTSHSQATNISTGGQDRKHDHQQATTTTTTTTTAAAAAANETTSYGTPAGNNSDDAGRATPEQVGGSRSPARVGSFDNCERCYLFTKSRHLVADTDYFPKALELIATHPGSIQTTDTFTLAGPSASSPLQVSLYESANRRAASSLPTNQMRVFEQSQLFNMNRFRNLLRFKQKRLANESIALEHDSENSRPAGGNAAPKRRQQLASSQRKRKAKGRPAVGSRSKRQAIAHESSWSSPDMSDDDDIACDDFESASE